MIVFVNGQSSEAREIIARSLPMLFPRRYSLFALYQRSAQKYSQIII